MGIIKYISIFVSKKNNFSLIKKKKNYIIYFYNRKYFIILHILKNLFFYDKNTNYLIILLNTIKNNETNSILSNYLNNLLFSWNNFFFRKLKFKGKGYRIKKIKIKNKLKLIFNKSHKTYFYFSKIHLKKLKKTKIILLETNKKKLEENANILYFIRKNNLYTQRGLKIYRKINYKKFSKKNSNI